jgi:sugar phosphate permease
MYFQSFGAVAIVKVNAPWFHVRERGVFGAVFGVLISLGVFFAYDGGRAIVSRAETYWVFFTPAISAGHHGGLVPRLRARHPRRGRFWRLRRR